MMLIIFRSFNQVNSTYSNEIARNNDISEEEKGQLKKKLTRKYLKIAFSSMLAFVVITLLLLVLKLKFQLIS